MGQVTVTINGRTYRLACGDGEEARVAELAASVSQRIDRLVAEVGNASQDLLLLMVALLLADELAERTSAAAAAKAAPAAKPAAPAKAAPAKVDAPAPPKPAQPKGEAEDAKAAADPNARPSRAASGA